MASFLGQHLVTRSTADAQSVTGRFTEPDSQESIKDGVQTAVEVRQCLSKEDPFLQTLFQETAVRYDIQRRQSVHQDPSTVRQPADEEAEDEDDGRLQRLPLQGLTLGVLRQFRDDDTVTG